MTAADPPSRPADPPTSAPPEQASPHSLGNRIARLAWGVVQATAFRYSPRPLHRVRNRMLRSFGAKLDPTARVYPRAKVWAPWNLEMGPFACIADDVDCYCVRPIRIGAHSTISQYAHLCGATHDYTVEAHPLVPMPITIGERVWVAAGAFVAPGLTIPDGVVLGAHAVLTSSPPAWTVMAGNPAKPIKPRTLAGTHDNSEPSA